MKGKLTMKKNLIFTSILLLTVLLSACASSSTQESDAQASGDVSTGAETQGNEPQSDAQAAASDTKNEFSMPSAMQLALGTFKLEGTDYPIGADQAQEMLVLWKAVRSLTESETTAAEEIEAVVNQIGSTMTAEQMQSVEAMELTFQDMGAIAEELGLEFGGAGRFEVMTPEMQATREAASSLEVDLAVTFRVVGPVAGLVVKAVSSARRHVRQQLPSGAALLGQALVWV